MIAALTTAPRRNRHGLDFRTRPRAYFDGAAVAEFLRDLLR